MSNIIKFRDQEIQSTTKDGVELIPIKPICLALNLDYKTQYDKVKEDEILSQLWGLAPITARDNKTYEMVCLPLEFIFGWLFSIGGQANETFRKYKLECYRVLYEHFIGRARFEMEKQNTITELKEKLSEIKSQHKESEQELKRCFTKLKEEHGSSIRQRGSN